MAGSAFQFNRAWSITAGACAAAALLAAPRRLGGEMAQFPTWRELGAEAEFSNYRGFIGPPGLSTAQVAYWEGVLAGVDRDESWQAYLEQNQLHRQLMNGRDARKYMDDLAVPLKAVLGDLGLLKVKSE